METKDAKILELTNELDELRNDKRPVLLDTDKVALEEEIERLKLAKETVDRKNKQLTQDIDQL